MTVSDAWINREDEKMHAILVYGIEGKSEEVDRNAQKR